MTLLALVLLVALVVAGIILLMRADHRADRRARSDDSQTTILTGAALGDGTRRPDGPEDKGRGGDEPAGDGGSNDSGGGSGDGGGD